MRRVAVILVALFLVNLPFVHDAITNRQIDRSGRDVEATLVRARTLDGRHFLDYRLPPSVDPARVTYTARVDGDTYERARDTHVIAVRVVAGKPAANRPAGEVSSRIFQVLAISIDVVALALGLLFWGRWRRRSLHEVVSVEDRTVTLASRGQTLTVSAPQGWISRVHPGDRVAGALRLVADGDVLPTLPLSGLEQLNGASYVVRGRVVDARSGRVELELADRSRLVVETGVHRVRADIRDSTEVRGTLCFVPRGFTPPGFNSRGFGPPGGRD